jgi:hypothetical protein
MASMVMIAPSNRQHVEKLWDCQDLIGLLRHLDLTEHEALARGEGGNHMNGGLRALLVAGSAHGLAIDRNHPRGNPRYRGHPGDEAALERIGVQSGEDVAEVIMGWRAILERAEPAEQSQLPGAEEGDLREALSPGQHAEQTQKQHLVERIGHLAALARVPKVLEIAQKDNRLGECRTVRCRAVHAQSPLRKSRTGIDSALQRLVTYSFTRLPCAGAFLLLASQPRNRHWSTDRAVAGQERRRGERRGCFAAYRLS